MRTSERNMMLNISFLLLSSLAFITAFQQQGQQRQHNGAAGLFRSSHPSSLKSSPAPAPAASLTSLSSSSAFFATDDDDDVITVGSSLSSTTRTIRNRLRKVTGFSFTVFRKTLRGITGISLTAVYATAFAATSLWIRKTMSIFLRLFPSGFRYFLQPFLILYYTPLILLRTLTGPSRKRAVDKHNTVIDAWKEAVNVAEKLEKNGYSPVSVNDDGYFELTAPPSLSIDDSNDNNNNSNNRNEDMADAMAEVMEIINADDEEKK
jgi:hypothetical protein